MAAEKAPPSTRRQIAAFVQARRPVWVVTNEEVRAERMIAGVARALKMDSATWRMSTGLLGADGKSVVASLNDANRLLPYIIDSDERRLYVLKDIADRVANGLTEGYLKDLILQLPKVGDINKAKGLVFIDTKQPPDGIKRLVKVIDYELPDVDVLGTIVDAAAKGVGESHAAWIIANRTIIVDAMKGLEAEEAAVQLKLTLITANGGTPDVGMIAAAKKDRLSKDGVLQWYPADPRGMDAIGGLDRLKGWLSDRETTMTPMARSWGLSSPKGIMIIGIPGCGKSLTAKAVAAAYGLPLLKFDVSSVFGKYVGDSESNMREAIRTAKAIAPAILWIDELDKGFANGEGDSGVSKRIIGSFLTEIQEGLGCFVVATANDITLLLEQFPELFRAGRFDAIFRVDLPTTTERAAIIEVMKLAVPHCIDVDATEQTEHPRDKGCRTTLIEVTQGFTGAEIEQSFIAAQYAAWNDGMREVMASDVVKATTGILPIAEQAKDKLQRMRDALPGAVPASEPENIGNVEPDVDFGRMGV